MSKIIATIKITTPVPEGKEVTKDLIDNYKETLSDIEEDVDEGAKVEIEVEVEESSVNS